MKKYVPIAGVAGLVLVAVAIPYFPRGTDLYVHVLWPWQVMRCLHEGSLPVWLPDLNAAFGSPGIGLYSPLGPSVCGVLGLILGTGGRGVRAALALAALAVILVAPGRDRRSRLMKAGLVLLSPAMLTEFFGRFPVSQLLGVPLAWLLLEHAAERKWRWDQDGVLFALLWLLHAPTAMMVAMISGLAVFAVRTDTTVNTDSHRLAGVRGQLFGAWQLGVTGLMAAGLSAWHWWPLLSSAPNFPFRSALTGGEHHPLRNSDRRVRPASSGDQHRHGLGGRRSPGRPGSQWRVENESWPASGGGDCARQLTVRPTVALFLTPRMAPVPVAMDVAGHSFGDDGGLR